MYQNFLIFAYPLYRILLPNTPDPVPPKIIITSSPLLRFSEGFFSWCNRDYGPTALYRALFVLQTNRTVKSGFLSLTTSYDAEISLLVCGGRGTLCHTTSPHGMVLQSNDQGYPATE
jgi:hypothetical protein